MKLCPQCEFIYEDEQKVCDMDGNALVYDTRLGVVPVTGPAVTSTRPISSPQRVTVMALVTGLVLSALLSFAYYASWPLLESSFASPSRNPEAPGASLHKQIALPIDNSSPQPVTTPSQSPTNPKADSVPANAGADESPQKPSAESARSHVVSKATADALKATDNRLTIGRRLPPLPEITPLPELPPIKRLPAAKPEAGTAGSTKRQKALVVDVKQARGNANKQTGVKGFLKKTARILKKPFKL